LFRWHCQRGFSACKRAFRLRPADNQLDPSLLASWLEIRSDNTILARTGRAELERQLSSYYAQAIAEELNVRPETISLILGTRTDGPTAGLFGRVSFGMANVRKVAGYTYQACWAGGYAIGFRFRAFRC